MSLSIPTVKIDDAFAQKAAQKYQSREALVKDIQDWQSLTVQLRYGLARIAKNATEEIQKSREELERMRKNYDKEMNKYAYETNQVAQEMIKAQIEGEKAVMRQILTEYYAIFGTKSDDYIVRDQGLNSDVKGLQQTTKSVKELYKLMTKANQEVETGKRMGFFGEEADFVEDENKDDVDY